ncbi:MAG TPA: hypothetical protein VKU19_41530 [Bryobacteraceae bacterium]|nr:hypothetical protein [Bryobacteraceae bacterium]
MNGAKVVLAFAACSLMQAQSVKNPDDYLEQIRARIRAMTQRMPRYTCVQTVERSYYTHPDRKPAPSCDQISADRKTGRTKLQLYATDRLRLDVAIADGREIVSWVGAGKFDTRRVDEIVGEGPTGTGAFGGHLVDIFSNSGAKFQFIGEKVAGGKTVLEYRFVVPFEASNYRIRGEDEWHFTAYDGTFQVDKGNLELLHLELRTDQLPADTFMCESSTRLDYQRLRIGESDFLLPQQSEMRILQTDAKETSNVTTFASCREYHTESTIRFDEEDAPAGLTHGAQATAVAKPLPEGLSLSLALLDRIDTSTAAAGDKVAARVTHAVKDPKSKETLIPAGAIARGRIARMRHRVGTPQDFIIKISFDSLEINGKAVPLSVRLDSVEQIDRIRVLMANRPRMRASFLQGPDTWGALIFPIESPKYVVPAGYVSMWHTFAPTEAK